MRYIRFLKPPRILEGRNPPKAQIHCLITITSDLGDSFLPYGASLYAELYSLDPEEKVLGRQTIQWGAEMRNLVIKLPFDKARFQQPVRVRIGPGLGSETYEQLHELGRCGIVSAWSAVLDSLEGRNEAAKLVERCLVSSDQRALRIWEEGGESIARHVWDAGMALSAYLVQLACDSEEDDAFAEALRPSPGKKRLQVLELGTGCGLVGISLGQSVQNADIIISDLPAAADIAQKNIQIAHLAHGTKLAFHTLDWEEELPKNLNRWCDCPHCTQLDLVVAADCTYNPDSSPALVDTITKLLSTSPTAALIVAMKVRHSAEKIFFDLMSEAGFLISHSIKLPLPGDAESGEEEVEIYLFRYAKTIELPQVQANNACICKEERVS